MNEQMLQEKLRKLEALFARPGTQGEQEAAGEAIERIKARIQEIKKKEREEEFTFHLSDSWSHDLFIALCRRYGLDPYRYYRQRYTTVNLMIPRSFMEQTLWPEFKELNRALKRYLMETTERIIRQSVHSDTSSERVVNPPLGMTR